jgi:FixJ family two-component response regulator
MDRGQRIVAVVDDDPRVRESLESLFDSAGIESKSFSSAEEVLRTGALEHAYCLITDVRMPGIDGCELQRQAAIAFPGLQVIFVTAHHDRDVQRRALELGAFAFFYKPFDSEELLRTVDAASQFVKSAENVRNISIQGEQP